MQKVILSLFLTALMLTPTLAQQPPKLNASQIHESIKKLNFLGSVLYVAAHPDDENTRLISYMANHVKARTAYLSLTRGDGGQNLIGPEIRESLGVIRTQELLAARRTDGGEQLFTRANDFGYSKTPDETLAIWNKDQVLSDVVWTIRNFKPDVIINRFNHETTRKTHGHHTSSAILSVEAFDIANDNTKYTKQLKYTSVWQPKRLFFNTSWWFYGSRENFEKADKSKLLAFDMGVYFPSSGKSNTEIAALSRSQHRSQGFGSTGSRGEQPEYIELVKGELPQDKTNIFEGIDTSWNRIEGGKAIGDILYQVEKDYDFTNPSASIPKLIEAFKRIQNLNDTHWKTIKAKEIKAIIEACAGLYLEVVANSNHSVSGEDVNLKIEAINRSHSKIELKNMVNSNGISIQKNISLQHNLKYEFDDTIKISTNEQPTTPYWLSKKGTLGMYNVDDMNLIGQPETPRKFNVTFNLLIENTSISFTKPIVYKTNDPVKGEIYKPFEIVPEVTTKISGKVIIFENDQQKEIPVIVKANRNTIDGTIRMEHPDNWSVYPERQKVSIQNKGEEQTIVFTVFPPKNQSEGVLKPIVEVNQNSYNKTQIDIDYEHIPFQTVLLPSEAKVVRLDIKKKGENIAYIEGAGDVVPESLQQIGYKVVIIKPEDITAETLNRFDAVVIGIRAYNTVETLKYKQQLLFDFVKNGGNMIVQYNTSHLLKIDNIAPFDLQLSRDRVTDENAEVRFLNPDHPILNVPNKITSQDFNGWTQERGLYFPDKWANEFTPVLSMNDKGETPKNGSLLVAKHGKGYYIYTGLSFFREFPEGVSGAYRLFANMLSIGKNNINLESKLQD